MRHLPPITAALALLAAAAATIPACSSAQHADRQPTQSAAPDAHAADSPDSPRALHRTLEAGGVLTHAQVTRLFATNEGRRTLRALAAEYPHIHFDGENRFAQIGTTYSFAYGGSVPSLKLNNGWMHPDYAVASSIMLVGTPPDAELHLEFTPDALLVHIAEDDAPAEPYTITWSEQRMTPWATIDHQAQTIAYQP